MAPRKTERILNLTICLLSARRYLSREQIRDTVEGYSGLSDAAFERTFERDKDDLRAMGVPVETGTNSVLFDDEIGYRIRRSDFELPPVEFNAAEAAVLLLAGQSWQQASMAASTQRALAKLQAGGLQPDPAASPALVGALSASEPAFEPLWRAVLSRSRVRFTYRGGAVRTLDPWTITSAKGRWYVTGFDQDRQEPRIFRLSRISDTPRVVAGPAAFEVPADVDPRAIARSLEPRSGERTAVLGLRPGRAPALRRRAEPAGEPYQLHGATFEPHRMPFADLDIAEEIASFGADAVVTEPDDLREAVIAHLRRVAHVGGQEAG